MRYAAKDLLLTIPATTKRPSSGTNATSIPMRRTARGTTEQPIPEKWTSLQTFYFGAACITRWWMINSKLTPPNCCGLLRRITKIGSIPSSRKQKIIRQLKCGASKMRCRNYSRLLNQVKSLEISRPAVVGSYSSHSDDLSDGQVEIIGGLLQSVKDSIDIRSGLEPIQRVRVAKSLSNELNKLKQNGFLVFAAPENQRLEGGIGEPVAVVMLHLSVIRESDANIVQKYSP